MALAHVMELLVERQTPGILRMAAVNHVADRAHSSLGLALEPDAPTALAIHHGDLFACPQIGNRLAAQGGCDPIRNAATGASVVKAEHQAGAFSRPAMVERIDAERPVGADQPCLDPLQKLKTWPPHQRAIAENPDICGIRGRVHLSFITPYVRFCTTLRRKVSRRNELQETLIPSMFLASSRGACMHRSDCARAPAGTLKSEIERMKVKLTDRFCANIKSGTRMEYFDEDTTGLALRVTEQGSKSWTYNYTLGDKRVRMTLGSYPTISLAGARTKAIEARTALEAGTDPTLTAIGGETFKAVCEDYQSREGKKLRTADWRKATLDRLVTLYLVAAPSAISGALKLCASLTRSKTNEAQLWPTKPSKSSARS